MSILNQNIVLKLNRHWFNVDTATPQSIFVDMISGAVNPLAIEYEKNEDGEYDLDTPSSYEVKKWDEWQYLPIREFDHSVRT